MHRRKNICRVVSDVYKVRDCIYWVPIVLSLLLLFSFAGSVRCYIGECVVIVMVVVVVVVFFSFPHTMVESFSLFVTLICIDSKW